ncbi:MAG: NAD(P)/FAD-dependent oxidoreductase [Gammaproteobacteria bacterium]|nr:NAD(P)/FAD-dependent oxidoreductase [Gammaproteobacteria bacterium]
MKVLVVGGGISGLSLALALANENIETEVFEQNDFVDTTGTGIQLSPNGSHIVEALPLDGILADIGTAPQNLQVRDGITNKDLCSFSLNSEKPAKCSMRTGYYHVARSSLIELLSRSARKNTYVSLHAKQEVKQVIQKEDSASIVLSDVEVDADFVVGCDGIHSLTHNSAFKQRQKRWTGFVAYRILCDLSQVPSRFAECPVLSLGPYRHIVTYPLFHENKLNCVFIVPESEESLESWSQLGNRQQLHDHFRLWSPDIGDLVNVLPEDKLFKWGLYRDNSLKRYWNGNRIFLIGDACRSVLPFTAQGAALALEDVALLTRFLCRWSNSEDKGVRFRHYSAKRKRRTIQIDLMNRACQLSYHTPRMLGKFRDYSLPLGYVAVKKIVHDFVI